MYCVKANGETVANEEELADAIVRGYNAILDDWKEKLGWRGEKQQPIYAHTISVVIINGKSKVVSFDGIFNLYPLKSHLDAYDGGWRYFTTMNFITDEPVAKKIIKELKSSTTGVMLWTLNERSI